MGSWFEIRTEMKALGGKWDEAGKAWVVPDGVFPAAQALANAENFRHWVEFLNGLVWCEGSLSESGYNGGLRAASLGVEYRTAWNEIAGRVRAVKGAVPDAWFDRNIGRAFGFADGGTPASGMISGPGTGTSDSITGVSTVPGVPDIAVSTDEYIIPADTVQKFGKQFFDHLLAATHTPVRR